MRKDDLRLDIKVENRERRVKRASSLFMSSNSLEIEDSIAESAEQNEVSDIGNQAPKRRHKSLPLSFIATNEEGKEMPSIELTPSASLNLGTNFDYEAEIANNAITNDSLEVNFNSPGPRAPIRQASSRSLLQFDNDLTIKGEFMDLESLEIEKYFGDNEQEKSSPSSSPKASSSKIETAKKNITDKSKSL
jgi:hypothetical protein